jgi:hypothetical protein
MKIEIILLIVALILFIGVYFCLVNVVNIPQNRGLKTGEVIIDNQVIEVEIAQTVSQQRQGLSNRVSLGENEGMLFQFSDYKIRGFWMKEMNFPLDIVWIKDDMILGIEAKVPYPFEKDAVLPIYRSPEEVNYVLEVNAGYCEKYTIGVGDKVILK